MQFADTDTLIETDDSKREFEQREFEELRTLTTDALGISLPEDASRETIVHDWGVMVGTMKAAKDKKIADAEAEARNAARLKRIEDGEDPDSVGDENVKLDELAEHDAEHGVQMSVAADDADEPIERMSDADADKLVAEQAKRVPSKFAKPAAAKK